MTLEPVYTVKEVAELERLSTGVITAKINAGDFPGAYKTAGGGWWRIPKSAIEAYRKELAAKQNPKPHKGIAPLSDLARARRGL